MWIKQLCNVLWYIFHPIDDHNVWMEIYPGNNRCDCCSKSCFYVIVMITVLTSLTVVVMIEAILQYL